MRAGKCTMRNCRRIQYRGPCIICNENNGIIKAFRNIPGINLLIVNKLLLVDTWIVSAFGWKVLSGS